MSSTLTITTTLTPTTEVTRTLRLRPLPVASADLLNRLATILEKFQLWADDLSLQLYEWGSSAVLSVAEEGEIGAREFGVKVSKQLDELEKDILVNPLTREALESPLIDRGWTWEKTTLDTYLKVSQISPFDGKPIQATTHEFAVDMMKWLKEVRTITQVDAPSEPREKKETELTVSKPVKSELSVSEVFIGVTLLARTAHAIKRQHILQRACKTEEQRYKQTTEQIKKTLKDGEERIRKRLEDCEKRQKERLRLLKEESQMQTTMLQSQMERLESNNASMQGQLSSAQQATQNLTGRNSQLLQEQERNRRKIGSLEDKLDRNFCIIQ